MKTKYTKIPVVQTVGEKQPGSGEIQSGILAGKDSWKYLLPGEQILNTYFAMMEKPEELAFPVLKNQTIGRNLAAFRKLREKKAWEVAEFVGLKEPSYTKYERGESRITIELIQKVAHFLDVNPIRIILAQPGHYIESISDPGEAAHAMQTEVMIKTMETMMQMNEALKKLLERTWSTP